MEKIKEKECPAYAEWGKFYFVHAPSWVWGIAFLCCAAEIFVSYLVEYRLYQGVLKTGTIPFAVFLIIFLVITWYRSEMKPPKPLDKTENRLNRVLYFLYIPLGIYLIFLGLRERWSFVPAFQIIFLYPTLLLPPKITNRLKAVHMLIFIYCLILAGTFAGVLAAGYISQPRAVKLLQEQGYENIVFQEVQKGEYLADDMPDNDFLPEDMETSVYLFSAEKDGELWAAAVSPVRGVIIGETPAPEGSEIRHWLDPQTLDLFYERWDGEIVTYEMKLE